MNDDSPSLDEWRELFKAADDLKRMAPWEGMYDSELFGVQTPETGEVGYCCVLGNAGQMFGLHFYDGAEGLDGYWIMANSDGFDMNEVANAQKFIGINFEDRDELRARDVEIIKQLGLKYRGRNAWPRFFTMDPGFAAWYLTAAQARSLTVAIQQTLDVAPRVRENPDLLPQFAGPDDEAYLVRVPNKTATGWEWEDTIQPPAQKTGKETRIALDGAKLEKLSGTLQRESNEFEVDYISMANMPIAESRNERPIIPDAILIVESSRGHLVGNQICPHQETLQTAVDTVVNSIEGVRFLPSAINVRRPELYQILLPVCAALKIGCALRDYLPNVDNAAESLLQYTELFG